jgi:hypothetical protein
MVSKNLDKNIGQNDYLVFLKHYSSELKFMSPWTQIDNAEQIKSVKTNDNITKNSDSQNKIKNVSFILSK